MWWKSSGNNGMGKAQMSITENLINQEGKLITKEFNNQADENLDFGCPAAEKYKNKKFRIMYNLNKEFKEEIIVSISLIKD